MRVMSCSSNPCPYQVNIEGKKWQLFQCLIYPWLILLLSPHFYFTMFHFLVINLWFREKTLWLTCLWMTFVLLGQVVLVELGTCLSWKDGNSLTSSGNLQGWIPQVNVNGVSHGAHIWMWIPTPSVRFWAPWVSPCLKQNTIICHSCLYPGYFLKFLFFKKWHRNNQLIDSYQRQWWCTSQDTL